MSTSALPRTAQSGRPKLYLLLQRPRGLRGADPAVTSTLPATRIRALLGGDWPSHFVTSGLVTGHTTVATVVNTEAATLSSWATDCISQGWT